MAEQIDDVPAERVPTGSDRPPRAMFRMPQVAIMAALFAMLCATPFAWAAPGLAAVYLLPIAFIVWVVRTRTVADASGLSVRTMFGERELPWSEIKGLALTPRAKVRAVLSDGSEAALPFVRPRHLPVLAVVSQGRISDPLAATAGGEGDADQEGSGPDA